MSGRRNSAPTRLKAGLLPVCSPAARFWISTATAADTTCNGPGRPAMWPESWGRFERIPCSFVGADASVRPAECTESSKILGEFVCTHPFDCRGRCLHRPGRMHHFNGNLRRIRNFPTGRCGHRPLQTWWDVHMDSPKIFAEQLCALLGLLLLQPLQKNLRQPDQNQESAE